ncbi:MAG TPA: PASTA domain-containing protein [Kofleriaceae bacterium]|nr:PASTA domain-containing protein [Kofleriaceae bacterium]
MKTLLVCLPILATSCIKTAAFSTSSPTAASDGTVTLPNVFKLKKADAIAALRKAGVEGDINQDDSLCGSAIDGQIIELGEVCYQAPAAGQRQGSRLVVSLRVQTEDPRQGDIGKITEWRLMPNMIGMTYDQAVAAMQRAGFTHVERIKTTDSDDATCKPRVVCKQYPDVLTRSGLNDDKLLYLGAEPAAAHASAETTRPAPAPAPSPTPVPALQPAPAPAPTTGPAPQPAKPTADQPPAPLFGAPPPPPTTAAKPATSAKPAYRGDDGRVHGPGGPVFMGKGEPCTAKRNHCLRAPEWFAADNVAAGAMYRGVPVYQFEGKWWNWRGDEVEPKRLFRTAVVDKPEQLQAGKPVVIFTEEGHERFLDSEYEMLTSSRWDVVVVDSIGTDTIKVKGWGDVPLDTVRQVVEEK